MPERKSRFVHGAKQQPWQVTLRGESVTVWAVTRKGAKSQAMSLLRVQTTAGMTVSPVK